MKRFLLLLVLLAAVAGGAWLWEDWNFHAPGPSRAETVVLIKPGEKVAAIGRQLQDAGAVSNANLFWIGVRKRGLQASLKAGEYALPAHASMADIAAILESGRSIQHKLTAAEGLTSAMIYALVQNDPVLVGDAGAVPSEGSLLPETYLFTRGTTRAQMLKRMEKARDSLLENLWRERPPGLPYKTPQEAVVLASIVEKETAIPDERRHIAGVFVNRLKLGMKLQSDPTIIYDVTGGYPLGRGIRESELARASPHNTYVIAGLPPTPICNPGKDALAAVLDPQTTGDLYFVANGQGGHVFSATEAEQSRNVAAWRKIERSRKQLSAPPRRK